MWLLFSWVFIYLVTALYIYLCPFTKVEESFNLQSIHDHVNYGIDLKKFDHKEFPGAVPRSFIGSVVVGYITKAVVTGAAGVFHVPLTKIHQQYLARLVISALVVSVFTHFLTSVKRMFGYKVVIWTVILTCTQFHFIFYSSRPLPNTFAVITALLSVSYWIRGSVRDMILYAGLSIIIFRSELAIMFGIILIMILCNNVYHKEWNKLKLIPIWIFCTGVLSLGLTVLVDSYYWGRWVWPEGEAFYFNAVLNKSSDWGTSPFFWYFYSALPRAMGLTLLLTPLGVKLDTRCLLMAIPVFGFIIIYSILPHKELRFIIYVVPVLNVIAARACNAVWINRDKNLFNRLLSLSVFMHLFINITMTTILLRVSYSNYPGGAALTHLNNNVSAKKNVYVHIDVYSAQTGVSLFLHEHENWRYDKTEDKSLYSARLSEYTHLLIGTPDEQETQAKLLPYSNTHAVVHVENCFKNVQLAYNEYPFINIRTAPCVWILEKNSQQ